MSVDTVGIDESLLIAKTRRIIAAIGLPLTLVLLQARGGTVIALPRKDRRWRWQRHVLDDIIGSEAAQAFYEAFANAEGRMLLPKADKLLIQQRDHQIRAEAETMSVRAQALKYRLTERRIQSIRNRVADDDGPVNQAQYDLFGNENPRTRLGKR